MLQAQILAVDHLVAACVVLAAIRTVKELAQETVQTHVAEAALVHAITLVVAHALALAMVHVAALARTAALADAMVVMVVAVVAVVAVVIAPAVAGKVTALVPVPFIATIKLLAVATVIASVATFHGKDWRLAHGRTNYPSNG